MNNKQIQQALLRRFNAEHSAETRAPFLPTQPVTRAANGLLPDTDVLPRHMGQFFKIAMHRKRHFLEKMLLDS